jgi:hypothetical protein
VIKTAIGVLMAHSTRAIRSNLSNSLARPERAGLLLAARRGSLDQGRDLACVPRTRPLILSRHSLGTD